MSHKMMSDGYIVKQPVLQQVGNTVKLEFDIASKRSVRSRNGDGWDEVTEYVTFVAWGDQASQLAESLLPGREVSAIGTQETSTWVDRDTQQNRSKKTYRLIHIERVIRRQRPQNQDGAGRGQSEYAAEQYDDYAGDPEPQGSHHRDSQSRYAPQQQRQQAAPQRQAQRQPAPAQRYANQAPKPDAPASPQQQPGRGRFDACY